MADNRRMGNLFLVFITILKIIMELKYNNREYDLDLIKDNGNLNLKINGETVSFHARALTDNILPVYMNNRYVNIYAAEDEAHFYVSFEGRSFTFDKILEEEKTYGEDNGSSADRDAVKPPMPGSIVKVLVEPDQKVEEGDALIIVEAMKMETTLYSSIDGIVKEVNVEAGEQVDANKVLILVEKE